MIKRPPIYYPDRIEIQLTRGMIAVVDLDCHPVILARTWTAQVTRESTYAVRWPPGAGVQYLAREILGSDVDRIHYIDGDPLNNRYANILAVSRHTSAQLAGGSKIRAAWIQAHDHHAAEWIGRAGDFATLRDFDRALAAGIHVGEKTAARLRRHWRIVGPRALPYSPPPPIDGA